MPPARHAGVVSAANVCSAVRRLVTVDDDGRAALLAPNLDDLAEDLFVRDGEDRAQSLGILAELRNGNVQVAQAATVPTSPSSPKVSRNTVLGGVVGLLLGLGVAFLLERLDRRIREPKDLEAIYGLPLLGVVPESAALSRSARSKQNSRRSACRRARPRHFI